MATEELQHALGGGLSSSPPRAVRILVVDDHEGFRSSMLQALDLIPDVEVAGEARSGDEACAIVLGGPAASAYVDARRAPDRITFAVGPVRGSAPPKGESGIDAALAGSLPRGLDLIALIFDDARIDGANDDDSVLRFSVPVDGPS